LKASVKRVLFADIKGRLRTYLYGIDLFYLRFISILLVFLNNSRARYNSDSFILFFVLLLAVRVPEYIVYENIQFARFVHQLTFHGWVFEESLQMWHNVSNLNFTRKYRLFTTRRSTGRNVYPITSNEGVRITFYRRVADILHRSRGSSNFKRRSRKKRNKIINVK